MMRIYKKAGFTIVELLIVIVLIAILAVITIVAYNGIQNRSRDSARDTAVTSIRKALELYRVENGGYPNVCGNNSGCNISGLTSFVVPLYTNSVPNDPDISKQILYVISGTHEGYGLFVRYESKPECKYLVGKNINNGWWGTGVPTC